MDEKVRTVRVVLRRGCKVMAVCSSRARPVLITAALGFPALLQAVEVFSIGDGNLGWSRARESSSGVAVSADSVWLWSVQPRQNIVPTLQARRGRVLAEVERQIFPGQFGPALAVRPGLSNMVDGDPGTVWNPDDDEEVSRRARLYVDLGASFGVDRMRLFPRLDGEHRSLFLGRFQIGVNDGTAPGAMLSLAYDPVARFGQFRANKSPVFDVSFPSRPVRYILLASDESEPWELAELEVYSDGTLPIGEFVSDPFFIRGAFPVWGQVLVNGGDAASSPVIIQTRTGPDPEPVHYFIRRGDELERTTRDGYFSISNSPGTIEIEQGPVLPNPGWSQWETVADGIMRSPGPRRYLQFRLFLSTPGFSVRRLDFEYESLPIADDLIAEVSPVSVEAGVETRFSLSLEVQVDRRRGDTGFRRMEVLTPALVHRISEVRVNDLPAVHTARIRPHRGFDIDLWRRVVQAGSFVQIDFMATVFRDGTLFDVRASDVRPGADGIEEVYQPARAGDADPVSLGGQLHVRTLQKDAGLVQRVSPFNALFTPDGDGVNDEFEVSYNLLKISQARPVLFEIFDLSGNLVRSGYAGNDASGRFTRVWDGLDENGNRVPVGVYYFRIQVETDAVTATTGGVVGVAY